MVSSSSILIWIIVPLFNFFICFHIGNNETVIECEKVQSNAESAVNMAGNY